MMNEQERAARLEKVRAMELGQKTETVARLSSLMTYINPDILAVELTDTAKYVRVTFRDGFVQSVLVEGDNPAAIVADVMRDLLPQTLED